MKLNFLFLHITQDIHNAFIKNPFTLHFTLSHHHILLNKNMRETIFKGNNRRECDGKKWIIVQEGTEWEKDCKRSSDTSSFGNELSLVFFTTHHSRHRIPYIVFLLVFVCSSSFLSSSVVIPFGVLHFIASFLFITSRMCDRFLFIFL